MKYAYYPGCSLHGSAIEFNDSSLYSLEKLGVEMWEIPDWTCCGASSAHSVDHLLGLAIPARNLIPPEKEGLDVVAPCAACWQRLVWVNHELQNNPKMKEKINTAIEGELQGTSKILTVMEAVNNAGLDKIKENVKKPLEGLKVACYYGCYYVKPPKIAHVDDPENPQMMDNIIEALGAEVVDWPFKTECCGASLGFYDKDTTLEMNRKILQVAKDNGADAIAVACPLCHANLDMRQSQINQKFKTNFEVPVFYFTELMAYAFGAGTQEIGINKHFVEAENILKKIG